MTNNIDRAAQVILQSTACTATEVSQTLAAEGLLTPSPQVIRTVEELQALDPLTVVYITDRDTPMRASDLLDDIDYDPYYADDLPAVVVATADQARAAREALEEA